MRPAAALLAVICLAACSAPVERKAGIEGPVAIGKLALVSAPAPALEPDRVQALLVGLAQRLHKRYGMPVLAGRSLNDAVWAGLDDSGPTACRALETELQRARKALAELRVGSSLEATAAALDRLDRCGPELESPQRLIALVLLRARGLLLRERHDQAMAAFRWAVALDPERVIDTSGFTPRQHEALQTARRQVLSAEPAAVHIESEPPGATIWIDGRRRGTTPDEAIRLYPGRHFIRLQLAGHGAWTRALPDGVPPPRIKAWLFPTPEGEAPEALLAAVRGQAPLDATARSQARAAATRLEADGLLLVRLAEAESGLALAGLLYLPAADAHSEWRAFELGSGGRRTAKGIGRVVRGFGELRRR
jgi:hypothetical protein